MPVCPVKRCLKRCLKRCPHPPTHPTPPRFLHLQVIEQYLLDKYASVGPSLIPPTPELRAKAHLASRIHDLYVQPLCVLCWAGLGWGWAGCPPFVLAAPCCPRHACPLRSH